MTQGQAPVAPTNNTQMAAHLNNAGAPANPATQFEAKAKQWFAENGKRLKNLLGSEEDARRLLIAGLNSISKTPSLMECTFDSFTRCLLMSAEYKLYPGVAGECAFVPFNNNKIQRKEATFIIQYQGVAQLLYRSGMVKDIEAAVVREKDFFAYKRGSSRSLEFEPFDGTYAQRGARIGVYCIIRNIFGGEHIVYMTTQEVMGIKARSKASGSSDSPWNSKFDSDVDWMWMKTALKQNAKLAPRSIREGTLAYAALADDGDEPENAGRGLDMGNIAQTISPEALSGNEQPKALDVPSEGVTLTTRTVEGEKVPLAEGRA